MDKYNCYLVKSNQTEDNQNPKFHLRVRWNPDYEIISGKTIFWIPAKGNFIRISKSRDKSNITISVNVKETMDQHLLLNRDDLNFDPGQENLDRLFIKFKINITKLDNTKDVIIQDFPVNKIALEYSLFS